MIFVECDADFILIKSITNIPKRQIIHPIGANKFEVCKSLEKHNNCIGLVDEDPYTLQPSSKLPYAKKMKIEKI